MVLVDLTPHLPVLSIFMTVGYMRLAEAETIPVPLPLPQLTQLVVRKMGGGGGRSELVRAHRSAKSQVTALSTASSKSLIT